MLGRSTPMMAVTNHSQTHKLAAPCSSSSRGSRAVCLPQQQQQGVAAALCQRGNQRPAWSPIRNPYNAPPRESTVTRALPEAVELTTSSSLLMEMAEAARLMIPGIVGDSQVREGLVSGFLLIFFSEIGDKTFFIALLLALRNPQLAVFSGTFGALAVMTVISVLLGQTLHLVDEAVPLDNTPLAGIPFDDILAAALLIWFGVQTIRDAEGAQASEAEEKEEAEEVVKTISAEDMSKLVLTTFTLVFAAEWGDKSFLATIALAAASSPLGVTGGAIAGHGVATALAVAGGSVLTKYFSPKILQYMGGSLFLVFAASTLLDVVVEMSSK